MSAPTTACRQIERRLAELGATPPAELSGAVRDHLAGCRGCRELLALARLEPVPVDRDLTRRVLEATSGRGCDEVVGWWAARLDGHQSPPAPVRHREHLERCAGCRELVRELERLPADLRRLSEISPGAGFTRAVLAATLPVARPRRRWSSRLWGRLVARPRFATEAAFAATLVLALLTAQLSGLPAVASAEAAPVVEAGALLDRGWSRAGRLVDRGPRLLAQGGDQLRTFWSGVASLLENEPSEAPSPPNPAAPAPDAARPDSEETT